MLGKVLCGVACIMALQGTGWSSNEIPSTGFVEANRHPGKLFEEPLGQRGLNELLTAFSEEEVAKMRSVLEEEPCYRADLWIRTDVEDFAQAKGISWKSLARLANRLESANTEASKRTLQETMDSFESGFERATLEQKCRRLRGMSLAENGASRRCELRWRGEEVESDPFYGTEDYESLMHELDYRYSLRFLETLLYLS